MTNICLIVRFPVFGSGFLKASAFSAGTQSRQCLGRPHSSATLNWLGLLCTFRPSRRNLSFGGTDLWAEPRAEPSCWPFFGSAGPQLQQRVGRPHSPSGAGYAGPRSRLASVRPALQGRRHRSRTALPRTPCRQNGGRSWMRGQVRSTARKHVRL